MSTRVRVDFNSVTKDGQVKATVRRADGPLAEGDAVIAYDPAEHSSHPAVVASINPDTERVLLAVDWEHAARDRSNKLSAKTAGICLGSSAKYTVRGSRVEPSRAVALKA
ncbi:hypothetical protein [Blastococcus mobilis]|uniref:Uncharacterized protein n=1 Tax=Blastococcus mobilis TaxID=1938746 RepID=A0A238YRD0_9ACTN|nr:hypothetical protein [Blastococcus mobilis]SNR73153.1 hypothetical protein SAMN06272737_121100 [Blastococcus mobilis]